MNNQFDKLIYESGLVAQGCWDKFDEYDKQALNKFAELIVRECLGIIDEEGSHEGGSIRSMEAIKQHFGVEE